MGPEESGGRSKKLSRAVRHILTAKGEVTTCESCDKPDWYECQGNETQQPCPVLGLTPGNWAVIRLYNRCKARRSLPYEGGVLDQPETLMAKFDVIDIEMAAYQREQMKPPPGGK